MSEQPDLMDTMADAIHLLRVHTGMAAEWVDYQMDGDDVIEIIALARHYGLQVRAYSAAEKTLDRPWRVVAAMPGQGGLGVQVVHWSDGRCVARDVLIAVKVELERHWVHPEK